MRQPWVFAAGEGGSTTGFVDRLDHQIAKAMGACSFRLDADPGHWVILGTLADDVLELDAKTSVRFRYSPDQKSLYPAAREAFGGAVPDCTKCNLTHTCGERGLRLNCRRDSQDFQTVVT